MSSKKFSFNFSSLLFTLFYALFFFTPLYFRFNTEELFEFNKMVLVYCFTLLITTVWGIRMIFEKKIIFSRSKLDVPLLLFVIVQLLATVISMHPRTSFLGYYSRFHGGFLSTLAYVALYYAFISTIEKKQVRQLFLAFFSSLSLVSIWGIFEHFGHSLSCVPLMNTFTVDCWVQDVQNRVFASFGQPNWMAAFIVGLVPLLLTETISKKSHVVEKTLHFITLTLALFALYYTKSRSGFLGLLGGLSVLATALSVLWIQKNDKNFKQPFDIRTLVGGILLVIGISLLVGTPYTPSLSQLLTTGGNQTQNMQQEVVSEVAENRLEVGGTDSGEIRKIVWEGALGVWKRYPLLGSGVETFAYSYYMDRPAEHNMVSEWDFLYNKAHNELLNFLATTGIAGLLTYLSIWIAASGLVIWAAVLRKELNAADTLTLTGCLAGLVAIMISNFFGFSTVAVSVLTFMLFAAISLLTQTTTVTTTAKKQTKKQSYSSDLQAWQYIGVTLLILICMFSLAKLYTYWKADVSYAAAKNYVRVGNYQQAIIEFQNAIEKSPKEALFYDTFSLELGKIAISLAEQQEATAAAQVAQTAIVMSDTALSLNNVHLNFYKSRARLFITLSQLEPTLLEIAKETLEAAIARAPNDPKLFYNLGVVETSMGNTEAGIALLETAVALKADYGVARLQLGREYLEAQRYPEAKEQFNFILKEIDPHNEAAQQALTVLTTLEATASGQQR